jgi:hypothetical protein
MNVATLECGHAIWDGLNFLEIGFNSVDGWVGWLAAACLLCLPVSIKFVEMAAPEGIHAIYFHRTANQRIGLCVLFIVYNMEYCFSWTQSLTPLGAEV